MRSVALSGSFLAIAPTVPARSVPPGLGTGLALADDLNHLAGLGGNGLLSLAEDHELPGGPAFFAATVREAGLH